MTRSYAMRLYTFHMFNARGECIHSRTWHRERESADENTECKTLFGLFFTMKDFARQMDPRRGEEDGGCNFYAYATNDYKLHYFETATGLLMTLTTDVNAGDLRAVMRHVYSNIYVEHVVKNPGLAPSEVFESAAFDQALDEYASVMANG